MHDIIVLLQEHMNSIYYFTSMQTDLTNSAKGSKDQVKKMV